MIDEKETKKESDEFWKELVYTDGKLDEEKVLNELADFSFVIGEVPKVYCAITGGRLSKPNYYADQVIAEFEDRNYDKRITQEDVAAMIKECKTKNELIGELKEYFGI